MWLTAQAFGYQEVHSAVQLKNKGNKQSFLTPATMVGPALATVVAVAAVTIAMLAALSQAQGTVFSLPPGSRGER